MFGQNLRVKVQGSRERIGGGRTHTLGCNYKIFLIQINLQFFNFHKFMFFNFDLCKIYLIFFLFFKSVMIKKEEAH